MYVPRAVHKDSSQWIGASGAKRDKRGHSEPKIFFCMLPVLRIRVDGETGGNGQEASSSRRRKVRVGTTPIIRHN
jgi:hypothetical protein